MKKFTTTFLIFVLIFISSTKITYSSAVNTFTEGVYKAADFNLSEGNLYSVSNISETDDVYVQLFDEKQLILQAIRLTPKSPKFNLIALKPDYRIVIVGKGQVYISQ
jgi:hypothetical protein